MGAEGGGENGREGRKSERGERGRRETYEAGLESRGRSTDLLLTLSTSGAVEAGATLAIAGSSTSGAGSGLGLLEGGGDDVIREVQVSMVDRNKRTIEVEEHA